MRKRFGLPERYLLWVGCLQHPDPRKHVAELAATPRELPLVLVGPTRPWAHELPDVILTGQVSDEHLAAIYSGAHALVLPSERRGLRPARRRGAGLRHAGRRLRGARAARGARRARHVRRARRPARADRGGPGGAAPRAGAAARGAGRTRRARPGASTTRDRPRRHGGSRVPGRPSQPEGRAR